MDVVEVMVVPTITFREEVATETSLDPKTTEVDTNLGPKTTEVITTEVDTNLVPKTTEVNTNLGPKTTEAEISLEVIIMEVETGAVVLLVILIKVESMRLKVKWDGWHLQAVAEAVAVEPALNLPRSRSVSWSERVTIWFRPEESSSPRLERMVNLLLSSPTTSDLRRSRTSWSSNIGEFIIFKTNIVFLQFTIDFNSFTLSFLISFKYFI